MSKPMHSDGEQQKKTAVFEIDFDPEMMWDEESAIKEHGSYLKAIEWLFEQDGIGIFDTDLRLVDIKDKASHSHLIEEAQEIDLSNVWKRDSFGNFVSCEEEIRAEFISLLKRKEQ